MAGKRDRKKSERARRGRAVAAQRRARPSTAKELLESTSQKAQQAATASLKAMLPGESTTPVTERVRTLALSVIRSSPQHGRYECKAGCAYCCHTAVTVAAPEAIAIADYVRTHFDDLQQDHLKQRLAANARRASSISRAEYIAQRVPCAMLDEQLMCRVHAVRPLACAGFLSTSVAKCEAAFRGAPGADPSPGDPYAKTAGLGASYGLKFACRNSDRDEEFYELHHAVLRALENPAAGAEWLSGGRPFGDCLT